MGYIKDARATKTKMIQHTVAKITDLISSKPNQTRRTLRTRSRLSQKWLKKLTNIRNQVNDMIVQY